MTTIHPASLDQSTRNAMLAQVGATSNWGPTALCRKITRLISDLFTLIISPFYRFSSSNPNPSMGKRVFSTPSISQTPRPNDLLLNFYRGTGRNIDGRTFAGILDWDDRQLEADHLFIQWLFPTLVPSKHNPTAPVLTIEALRAFQNELVLVGNLQDAFTRMIRFYGLWFDPARETIQRAPNFGLRQRVWLTPNNHNFLRITRILTCLNILGLDHELEMFKHALESIAASEGKGIISEETLKIWRHAAL
jgi:hypothetical protein